MYGAMRGSLFVFGKKRCFGFLVVRKRKEGRNSRPLLIF
jgi:hypothetical protein